MAQATKKTLRARNCLCGYASGKLSDKFNEALAGNKLHIDKLMGETGLIEDLATTAVVCDIYLEKEKKLIREATQARIKDSMKKIEKARTQVYLKLLECSEGRGLNRIGL